MENKELPHAATSSMKQALTTCIPQRTVHEVHRLASSADEYAFLDVREEGVYCQGHPFYAVSAPLSHLETRLRKLVPRRSTPIVLMDDGTEDLAERAYRRMREWGYSDVAIINGGLAAWSEAGFPVFSGIYVPSKAFGEYVEQQYGTPSIDAATLASWMNAGKDLVVLDARPYEEFHRFTVPGAINCPGAELVPRVNAAVKSPNTTVVITCAGRTRGLIGAQSLINSGIVNPVFCLKNGTQGWVLSGREMEFGSIKVAAPATAEALKWAEEAAAKVAKRFNVIEISSAALDELESKEERTLYCFDVRAPDEYAAGHLSGFRSAPGGQLVQSTDHFVGTRNARIVLCDDTGIRARLTASWLLQLGWKDVYVLAGGIAHANRAVICGQESADTLPLRGGQAFSSITVHELQQELAHHRVNVLDLASSLEYRRAHIPGAWFIVRSRLLEDSRHIGLSKPFVLTSMDGDFACLAANDLSALAGQSVSVLEGGTAAWKAAGLPLSEGESRMASTPNDVWYSPFDSPEPATAMEAYLKWEVELMDRLELEGGSPFMLPSADASPDFPSSTSSH